MHASLSILVMTEAKNHLMHMYLSLQCFWETQPWLFQTSSTEDLTEAAVPQRWFRETQCTWANFFKLKCRSKGTEYFTVTIRESRLMLKATKNFGISLLLCLIRITPTQRVASTYHISLDSLSQTQVNEHLHWSGMTECFQHNQTWCITEH